MSNPSPYKKLLLLLSSENDGEVIAAARAIGRKLKADGKDWYWLADRLDGFQSQAFVVTGNGNFSFSKTDFTDWREAFDEAIKRAEKSKTWRPASGYIRNKKRK